MATFHFELVSPEKLLFSGDVEQVDVPGAEGDFGMLAGHAPMVTTLRPGILTVHAAGGEQKMVVLGGFAEVSEAGLTILADLAEKASELDRAVITTRISELEQTIAKTEPGSALDRLITRLDHYKTVDHHLTGTAMH
ncbi:MAG TPA: F0F1 ATP synthase subunit epsilon [Pseudolabrys sp.]|nr:F0F1 ATP synthase subunit epsilon [Pseudolabrys sp.]